MSISVLYKEESYRIIGACFAVYNEKGAGFLEAVYQECLTLEFTAQNLIFQEKKALKLYYKNTPLTQRYEPDFLCFGKVILEIKAVKMLTDEHRAQIINYLKATRLKLGLLVNFGYHPDLQYERFVNLHDE